jgi:hypothetical protein
MIFKLGMVRFTAQKCHPKLSIYKPACNICSAVNARVENVEEMMTVLFRKVVNV